MPVSAIRILDPKDTRNFSRYGEDLACDQFDLGCNRVGW